MSILYDSTSSAVQNKLDEVDKDSYALTDHILSGRQYPALKQVTFDLLSRVPRSKVTDVISEDSLAHQLSLRFPVLHASGRLVTILSVQERHPLRRDTVDLGLRSGDVYDFLASISARLRHLSCHEGHTEKASELVAVSVESLSSLHVGLFLAALDSGASPRLTRTYCEVSLRLLGYLPAFPIDLTPAINLHILSLDVVLLQDLARAAHGLSRATLLNLIEVRFSLSSITSLKTTTSLQDEFEKIDKDSYAQIDQTLSGCQLYPALQKIVFQLQFLICSSVKPNRISEDSLARQLSSEIPALHASGWLVWVDHRIHCTMPMARTSERTPM
ncbi:uncharacterized protein FIBRA_03095 [Fibroporia radiculosa]|uniref:Uncharacterized protein n=1 Tax=Fibroporia radiculosa TaxID=599839 RepID=J4HVT0_9APHY|nr:uncharacterized protein FIBRA_03095 [Fibroporia radiculosa]CCM01047.1 predicted protein [Fibroporia radiculosa]